MANKKINVNRRNFIKSSAAGLAATAIFPSLRQDRPSSELQQDKSQKKMIFRTLGKTGVKLPVVSLGSVQDNSLYNSILDFGISLIFTAQFYENGNHERAIGETLKNRKRDSYLIATAIGIGAREDRKGYIPVKNASLLAEMFGESLARLKMDFVDVFFLSFAKDRKEILNDDFLTGLQKLKKDGKTRFVGVATHENEAESIRAAVDSKVYDVVLAQYNFRHPQGEDIKKAFAQASKAGLGTLAMKTHAGRYWDKERKYRINTKAALKWVINDENIHSALYRIGSIEEIHECFSIMENLQLTPEEERDLRMGEKLSLNGLFCPQCRKCVAQCKKSLDIPMLMRSYMYAYGYKQPAFAKETLDSMDPASVACIDCSRCIVHCSMGFNVRERILDIMRIKDIPDEFLVA